MANMFALILAIATLITGIIWSLEKFKWAPAREKKVELARINSDGAADGQTLAKIGQAPMWIESSASFFPVLAIVFIIRSFIYEPFQIPSGSMMPTLLIGDFILVEKYAYGIKDPITQTTLIKTGTPARGDIAVFKYPLDTRIDYIKRIVGLPGDIVHYDPLLKTISITTKSACIQSADNEMACPAPQKLVYQPVEVSDFVQGTEIVKNGEMSRFYQIVDDVAAEKLGLDELTRLNQRNELLGEQEHSILLDPNKSNSSYFRQQGSPVATWLVPEGYYFMMGDNRDNSADSRYWGFVPEKNMVGKATTIWMSFEKQEGEWPTGVRLSRIGGIH